MADHEVVKVGNASVVVMRVFLAGMADLVRKHMSEEAILAVMSGKG